MTRDDETLWLAFDTEQARIVVVERHPRDELSPARCDEAVRVARAVAHVHFVEILDAGVIDTHAYLSREWIDGANLAAVLDRVAERGDRFPHPIAIGIILQICDALAHALAVTGLVVGEIAAAKLLVGYDGHARLAHRGEPTVERDALVIRLAVLLQLLLTGVGSEGPIVVQPGVIPVQLLSVLRRAMHHEKPATPICSSSGRRFARRCRT